MEILLVAIVTFLFGFLVGRKDVHWLLLAVGFFLSLLIGWLALSVMTHSMSVALLWKLAKLGFTGTVMLQVGYFVRAIVHTYLTPPQSS